MKKTDTEKQGAIAELKKILKPGDTVYTILRHVSKSGTYRAIDLYVVRPASPKNGVGAPYPRRITFSVAQATGNKYDRKHEAIGVSGCGMDMGFHLVYGLSHVLFPDGFKVDGKKTFARNGDKSGHDNDGGYALRHSWL